MIIFSNLKKYFHIRDEGETGGIGFNFYPLSSKSSFGCIINIANRFAIYLRYSKLSGKFHFNCFKLSEKNNDEFAKS